MHRTTSNSIRRGSVYLAVLGTALIASVLAFSALALQRVQNRMLSAAADMRQAQLNAEAAIKLGLLTIKSDPNWRTNYANGTWFSNRDMGVGSCTLSVTDPLDANLADNVVEPAVLTGTGTVGSAVQRVVKTIDIYAEPLGCLRSSVAAGNAISLNGATLRASNSGIITANTIAATGAAVYGRVQSLTATGSSYTGTTTQIGSGDLPAMPNWSTVFDFYRTNGTEIPLTSLSTSTGNLGRNVGFESGSGGTVIDWTGSPPGIPVAQLSQVSTPVHSGSRSVRVSNRTDWYSGAAQTIDGYVKPGQQYLVEAWVNASGLAGTYHISLYTKGTGNAGASLDSGGAAYLLPGIWTKLSATLTAPSWSGSLEYAFVKISTSNALGGAPTFYVDDVLIRETTTGYFIYRRVLGPGVNSLGGAANPQGLYWINCNGNKLIIERSRIKGTLLVINPGIGSMVGAGPINWSPATPGYPALLVDADVAANADFTIAATNRSLSEAEDSLNYNPPGVSYASLGTDSDMNDIYPSMIEGLVVVEDDLLFQGNALVRGSVIAGDNVMATSGSLEVDYRPSSLYSPPPGFTANPNYVSRPLSVHKEVVP